MIDLGDSDEDDDDGYVSKPVNDNPAIDYKSPASDFRQDIAVRPSKPSPIEIKDDETPHSLHYGQGRERVSRQPRRRQMAMLPRRL